jgi:formate-dependent nitrite reductase membrane component NrfD
MFCLIVLGGVSFFVAAAGIVVGIIALIWARGEEMSGRFVNGMLAFSAIGLGLIVLAIDLSNGHP